MLSLCFVKLGGVCNTFLIYIKHSCVTCVSETFVDQFQWKGPINGGSVRIDYCKTGWNGVKLDCTTRQAFYLKAMTSYIYKVL